MSDLPIDVDRPVLRVRNPDKYGDPVVSTCVSEVISKKAHKPAKRGSYRELPDERGRRVAKTTAGSRKRSLSSSSSDSGDGGFPDNVRTIHKDVAAIRERFPGTRSRMRAFFSHP